MSNGANDSAGISGIGDPAAEPDVRREGALAPDATGTGDESATAAVAARDTRPDDDGLVNAVAAPDAEDNGRATAVAARDTAGGDRLVGAAPGAVATDDESRTHALAVASDPDAVAAGVDAAGRDHGGRLSAAVSSAAGVGAGDENGAAARADTVPARADGDQSTSAAATFGADGGADADGADEGGADGTAAPVAGAGGDDWVGARSGGRVAAFFDLDKTIIASSSTLAFSRPFYQGGLINRRAALRSAYAKLVFVQSGTDAEQVERLRAHLTSLCQGWDVEQVRSIVEETLHDVVDPLVYAEAADLIRAHRERGHDVVVVSASGEEMVAPIAALVGATHSAATRMAVADGRYTGEIAFYCYGDEKATAMRELAEANGYDLAQCHAYTDSITDLPMLEAVGHPSAVNPNRALRKVAVQRGWPVLAFSDPVPLRAKIATPAGGMMVAATAVGLGAVAAGVTWYGMRRHRTRWQPS